MAEGEFRTEDKSKVVAHKELAALVSGTRHGGFKGFYNSNEARRRCYEATQQFFKGADSFAERLSSKASELIEGVHSVKDQNSFIRLLLGGKPASNNIQSEPELDFLARRAQKKQTSLLLNLD